MIFVGLDLAKNHFGLVMKETITGVMQAVLGWNNQNKVTKWEKLMGGMNIVKGVYDSGRYSVVFLPSADFPSKEAVDIWRYRDIARCIREIIMHFVSSNNSQVRVVVGLEGYAISGGQSGNLALTQTAEEGGLVKDSLLCSGHAIRVIDPLSVKMWAGKGNYKKQDMVVAAQREGLNIPACLLQTKDCPGSDIADAYFLMSMVEAEGLVRARPRYMDTLPERRRMLFNRVTKAFPDNVLCRPFLASKQPVFDSLFPPKETSKRACKRRWRRSSK